MALKGAIHRNHVPNNTYTLFVVGLPPITFTKVSGMDENLVVVELPGYRRASQGRTQAGECVVEVPLHHAFEIAAMEFWFQEGQDPKLPTYKKIAILQCKKLNGDVGMSFTMVNVFVRGRRSPAFDMAADGEMTANEYTLSWDDLLPI